MDRVTATVFFLLTLILSACGQGQNQGDDDQGRPPQGAELISDPYYQQLVASGNWDAITADRAQQQEAAQLRQDAADDEIIQAFQQANPDLGPLLPQLPRSDSDVVKLSANGNLIVTATLRDGSNAEFITHGTRTFKRNVANGLRVTHTRGNQLSLYAALYRRLPADWQSRLTDPDTLAADPTTSADDVRAAYQPVLDSSETVIAGLKPDKPLALSPGLKHCDGAYGFGTEGDMAGNNYSGACDLNPYGIVALHDWPLKPYITCVKHQGKRGTCTAFANTSALESAVWWHYQVQVALSEQALYNRARRQWQPGDFGDGLVSHTAFQHMVTEKFPLYFENQWNYNPSPFREILAPIKAYKASCKNYPETCSDTTHQSGFACKDSNWKECGFYVPDKNPANLGFRIQKSSQYWDPKDKLYYLNWTRVYLAAGGPIVITLSINQSLLAASQHDGMVGYLAGEASLGLLAMHLVGMIDNGDLAKVNALRADAGLAAIADGVGGGYMIVKNAFGNCFGDGGFAYLPYQTVLDNTLAMDIVDGVY